MPRAKIFYLIRDPQRADGEYLAFPQDLRYNLVWNGHAYELTKRGKEKYQQYLKSLKENNDTSV